MAGFYPRPVRKREAASTVLPSPLVEPRERAVPGGLESSDRARGKYRRLDCDRESIIDRQPFRFGPVTDKIVAFFVGIFLPVISVPPTAIAMFLWARTDDEDESYERRRHARSVTFWCGVGSLVMVALMITIIAAVIEAVSHNHIPTSSASPLR
jgi:hypothetical protein